MQLSNVIQIKRWVAGLSVLALVTASSCKKFLTVNPRTEIPQDALYNSETGFKEALTGVYIQLKDPNAYGAAMTMTTMEYLASNWDVLPNTTEERIALFNLADADVQSRFHAMYSQAWKTIAGVNAILGRIDARKDVFRTAGMFEMIKGECLAIRAYCHLDMLRIFGPVPGSAATESGLPYVTTLSNAPHALVSLESFRTALLKDLADAAVLLKGKDPVEEFSLADLRAPGTGSFKPADDYLAYRYLRLNYFAVKALEARAMLWFGEKEKAFQSALEVIDATNPDGSRKFRLGTSADMTAENFSLTAEHIFGLHDFEMYTAYTEMFVNGNLRKGNNPDVVNTLLYENSGTDIREANLWQVMPLGNQQSAYVMRKYKVPEKVASLNTDFRQIPMLRISEMYLIAIESGDAAKGEALWQEFRTARNLLAMELPAGEALRSAMLKEYRKEFHGEGQGFFACKRLNAGALEFLFAPAAAEIQYQIPVPLQ